jgi:hypothetical protein
MPAYAVIALVALAFSGGFLLAYFIGWYEGRQ